MVSLEILVIKFEINWFFFLACEALQLTGNKFRIFAYSLLEVETEVSKDSTFKAEGSITSKKLFVAFSLALVKSFGKKRGKQPWRLTG